MWFPSPNKVEILMLIQRRDKGLVSYATLCTTFALQANWSLGVVTLDTWIHICSHLLSYLLYYSSIPPRSGPYWNGVCGMIVLEKIALVSEATTLFLNLLILILVWGSQNIILGSWRPRLPSWGPNCWNHPRYLTLPVSLGNGWNYWKWNRRVYLVYHNMFFDVL